MKVLHVTKKYPNALGGDAIVVKNLEKQQKRNGHEVFILTTNCDEIQNKKNLIKFGLKDTPQNLDNITIRRIFSLINLRLVLPRILEEIKPDVVHCHSVDMGYVISKACKRYNVPLIQTLHGVSFNEPRYSFLKRRSELFFLRNSNFSKVITVDENSLNDLKNEGIANSIYLPNGVDLVDFKRIKGKTHKKMRFVFVGRLEEQKGLTYLVKATKMLAHKNKDFEILIIGEGSKQEELSEEAKKLDLEDFFKFLGKQTKKEIINLYNSSDVFILPSIWEGFPLTLLEAWAAGLPVIVTNVGGISKICKDKENSIIIPQKDPEAIAEAMLTLIKDKRLREKLGKNGRKLVEKKYDWSKINKKLEEVYKK